MFFIQYYSEDRCLYIKNLDKTFTEMISSVNNYLANSKGTLENVNLILILGNYHGAQLRPVTELLFSYFAKFCDTAIVVCPKFKYSTILNNEVENLKNAEMISKKYLPR